MPPTARPQHRACPLLNEAWGFCCCGERSHWGPLTRPAGGTRVFIGVVSHRSNVEAPSRPTARSVSGQPSVLSTPHRERLRWVGLRPAPKHRDGKEVGSLPRGKAGRRGPRPCDWNTQAYFLPKRASTRWLAFRALSPCLPSDTASSRGQTRNSHYELQ